MSKKKRTKKKRTQRRDPRKEFEASATLEGLPPSLSPRWLVSLQALPEEIDRARTCELLLVADPQGFIRGSALLEAPPSDPEIVEAFATSLLNPTPPHTPARPRELVVDRPKLARLLQPLADRLGFAIEVDDGLDFKPLIDSLLAHLGPMNEVTITGAPYAEEERLARAAARFATSAPWRFIDDSYVYQIRIGAEALPLPYAVVMGSAGMVRGLALYPTLEAYWAMRSNTPSLRNLTRFGAVLQLEPKSSVDRVVQRGFARRGLPLSDELYPWFIEVFDGEPRPLETPAFIDAMEIALHAIAVQVEASLQGRLYVPTELTPVWVPGREEPVEVIFRAPERAAPQAPFFEFEHVLLVGNLDADQLDRANRSARRGGGPAVPPRAGPALVIRATKSDARRGMKSLDGSERLQLTTSPPALLVSGRGTNRPMSEAPDAFWRELRRLVGDADDGTLRLMFVGGGTKRSPGRFDLDKVVGVLEVPIELVDEATAPPRTTTSGERFTFEVTLEGIEPRIWRRFTVPTDATFEDLHRAIQAFAGWDDAHLYEFYTGSGRRTRILATAPGGRGPWDEMGEDPDAELTPLSDFFVDHRRRRCGYRYDLGDDWTLEVRMIGVEGAQPSEPLFELLDGERAFPPEDSGGIWEYPLWVQVATGEVDDPGRAEWLGDWHPEQFDREALQRRLDVV